MALTPEDVVNKEFSSPKGFGRSGYDVVQVDDFLDEIVVELKRLNAENEKLATKLDECRKGKGQAPVSKINSPAPAPGAPAGGAVANGAAGTTGATSGKELDSCLADLAAAREATQKAQAEHKKAAEQVTALQKQLAEAQRALEERKGSAENAPTGEASESAAGAGAAGVIALAQRLHDEHVKEGQTKRDQLIADAQAHHDKVVGEATAQRDELVTAGQKRHDELVSAGQSKHDQMLQKATAERDKVVGDLTAQRETLSSQISHLRQYHDSYRSHLRDYLSSQLKGLEHTPLDDFDEPSEQPASGQQN